MLDPNKVDLVIYHANCSDGFGAAYSAWKLLGNRAEYFPAVHGGQPPDVTGKNVVCLDFAYDRDTTKKMIEDSNEFLIIDHHKTNIVNLYDISQTKFDLNKSGALMAWEFFHPTKPPPKFIQYIQDRDLWLFELPYSREFSASFDMVPFEFEEFNAFLNDSVFDDAVKRGSYILGHKRSAISKIAAQAVRKEFMGFDILVVNCSHWISEVGDALSNSADIGFVWFYDHNLKKYKVSLRASRPDIDTTEISTKFGGGGHKSASGFTYDGKSIDDLFEISYEKKSVKKKILKD